MFIRGADVTYVETQFNHSELHKLVKNGQKHQKKTVEGSFSIKLTTACKKTKREMFCIFVGMT